jgi:beta-lactam-binding protein with PASTA domain
LYKYGVIATNSAGRACYIGEGFLTCPSQGACPYQPYLPGPSLWAIEGVREAGAEVLREEREKEAAEATAAKEREAHEAGERAGREAVQRVSSDCVVPRLKGDTLAAARRALDRAHCRPGKLTKPRRLRGPLIVVKQSVRSNSELAPGSRVALTLGAGAKRQAARMS